MQIDIHELAAQVMASRTISHFEQQFVSGLWGEGDLTSSERELIARLFYGIRHGLLEVVE